MALRFLAKVLIVAIFIAAGTNKFNEVKQTQGMIKGSLTRFDTFLTEQGCEEGLPFKAELLENTENLVYFVAVAEVGGGLAVLGGLNFVGYLLALMVFGFTAIVHNPLYEYKTEADARFNIEMAFLNLCVIAV